MSRHYLFGLPMDLLSMQETVNTIRQRIQAHIFTQHVVVNVAKVVYAQNDAKLKDSIKQCDIVNVDGMGLVWGARFLGCPVEERVTGIDLFFRLNAMAASEGLPVYFLGARESVIHKTVWKMQQRFPSLNVAGFHHGYFWDDEAAVVEQIRHSGARLLFVAVSSPKKEQFINQWREQLGVDFVMGVGGTFDVAAGQVKRAPLWMQRIGMEWLYRLLQEPARMWRRYLYTNARFLGMLITEKFRAKPPRRGK